MNYEEKYKRAMKVMKEFVKRGSITIDFANAVFPELAESEDERIRKKLISYFSAVKGFSTLEYNYGITNEEAVTWLEKQGEYDSIEEFDFFDDFRNSDVEVDSNEGSLIAATISHKPADKAESKFHEGEWITIKQ